MCYLAEYPQRLLKHILKWYSFQSLKTTYSYFSYLVFDYSTFINYLVPTSLYSILLLCALHFIYLIIFQGGLSLNYIDFVLFLLSIGFLLLKLFFSSSLTLAVSFLFSSRNWLLILIHSEKKPNEIWSSLLAQIPIFSVATVLCASVQKNYHSCTQIYF